MQLYRFENSEECFRSALELDPSFVGARLMHGGSLFLLGHYRDAIAEYTRVIELRPWRYQAYIGRSRAWRQLGEFARAKADMTSARWRAPFAREIRQERNSKREERYFAKSKASIDQLRRDSGLGPYEGFEPPSPESFAEEGVPYFEAARRWHQKTLEIMGQKQRQDRLEAARAARSHYQESVLPVIQQAVQENDAAWLIRMPGELPPPGAPLDAGAPYFLMLKEVMKAWHGSDFYPLNDAQEALTDAITQIGPKNMKGSLKRVAQAGNLLLTRLNALITRLEMTDEYRSCKIFVLGPADRELLIALAESVLASDQESPALAGPQDTEVDVRSNDERDDARLSDFFCWPYYLDVTWVGNPPSSRVTSRVSGILESCWARGWSAVASCNYESELPYSGGLLREEFGPVKIKERMRPDRNPPEESEFEK